MTDIRADIRTAHAAAKPATSGPAASGPEFRSGYPETRRTPRWPLLLLALPAVVAIWSGWVGLGGMTGFGVVHPLPGIADGLTMNSAITLPIGMEVYAAYALRAWLGGSAPARARTFAQWSATAALGVGAAGQIAYHLMTAAGWSEAPWPVTTAVACVPVAVLGMGAALAHLLSGTERNGAVPFTTASSDPVPAEPRGTRPEEAEPAQVPAVPEPELQAEPGLTEPVEPGTAPEPVVEPKPVPVLRLAPQDTAERGPDAGSDAPTKQHPRYPCDCGCGREVPKATLSRHRSNARTAVSG